MLDALYLMSVTKVLFGVEIILHRDNHCGAQQSIVGLDMMLYERLKRSPTSACSLITCLVQESNEAKLLLLLAIAKIGA